MHTLKIESQNERREHARHRVVRLCKIRDRRSLLFSPGQTCDISVGGAMLRVDRSRPFSVGDEIDMVIAWGNDAVLTGDAIVRGTIKRVTPIDHHHQSVAVRFESLPALRQPVTVAA